MQVHFPALKSYAYVLEADRHTPLTGIAHSGIGGGIGHGIRRGGSLLNLSFHHQPLSPALSLSCLAPHPREHLFDLLPTDRKSTRLNSSHGYISYAVFC